MDNKDFTVHDRLGPVTVTGRLLVDKRFGSDKPRWTDMALYQIVETGSHWQVAVQCGGCTPPRRLAVGVTMLADAPVVCGGCQQTFSPITGEKERPFRYALEIIARSWVYHRHGGPCVKSRHAISRIADVKKSGGRWRNLYPCRRCNPPDLEEMGPNERIAEEREDCHVILCTDATSIVYKLYRRSGDISELAAKLLYEAAAKDDDIARALRSTRRI
jgi:hypothetical protein